MIIRRLKQYKIHLRWLKFKLGSGINDNRIRINFVISITSQIHRYRLLKKTLKSLIVQKNNKTEIHVYITENHKKFKKLEKWGREYAIYFIKIPRELGPYNKIYGPLFENIKKPILILDDDTYYPLGFLNYFYEKELKENRVIFGTRGAKYLKNALYNNFDKVRENYYESKDLILTGKGGILFDFSWLQSIAKNTEFINLAPYGDDLWYYFYFKQLGFQFGCCRFDEFELIDWPGEAKKSLRLNNVNEKRNDTYIKNLENYFRKF